MNSYKVLNKQNYTRGEYSIVPIRSEDRYSIMKWRNEQMYHLRQNVVLTKDNQDEYFNQVVSKNFEQDRPPQILFSYLKEGECIGYGGLVHINWIDKYAEVSFIIDTKLEDSSFEFHWINYLSLLKELAFNELALHKIFTYAFDLRPRLYKALEEANFVREATLQQHCLFRGKFIDVVIHSCFSQLNLRLATKKDLDVTFKWAVDEKVRAFSFGKDVILFDNHKQWFEKKISNLNTHYFILENSFGTSLGSVRVDLNEDEEWIISYLIDSDYHGKGLGIQLLSLLESKMKEINVQGILVGFVQNENQPSINIFRKLDYIEEQNESITTFKKNI